MAIRDRRFVKTVTLCISLSTIGGGAGNAHAADIGDASWKLVQIAAIKEGRVILLGNPVPAVLARLKADFDKSNPGIVLEYTRISAPPQLLSKADQDRLTGADGADVVLTAGERPWFEERAKNGQLRKPSGPASRNFPAAFMIGGMAPILALEPLLIAYNTNLVKTPVTSYADLLRPEFKGRMGTAAISGGLITAWYDWLEKTQGADFLEKFAAQSPKIYAGAVPNTQAVASGEIAATAFSNPSTSRPIMELGAPIQVLKPNPAFGISYGGAIVAWAKRPNAAAVFMDYLMSPRGQATWSGGGDSASVLPGIPGSMDAKTINPVDPVPYTPEVVKAYIQKWEKLLPPR